MVYCCVKCNKTNVSQGVKIRLVTANILLTQLTGKRPNLIIMLLKIPLRSKVITPSVKLVITMHGINSSSLEMKTNHLPQLQLLLMIT